MHIGGGTEEKASNSGQHDVVAPAAGPYKQRCAFDVKFPHRHEMSEERSEGRDQVTGLSGIPHSRITP